MASLGDKVLKQIKDHGIAFDWAQASSGSDQPTAAQAASTKSVKSPESIDQMKDKVYQASKIGFAPGNYVCEKKAADIVVWRIDSITADTDTVKLIRIDEGEDGHRKEVPFDTLLTDWRAHKGKVTELLPGWDFATNCCSPLDSKAWELEAAKGAVALAMRAEYQKHAGLLEHVRILMNPTIVKVTKNFKVGKLSLVCASTRIDRKTSNGSFSLGTVGSHELHAASHFSAPLSSTGEPNQHAWVAPFWLVPSVEGDANMALKTVSMQVHGFTVGIPILVNSKELHAGDHLRMQNVVQGSVEATKRAESGSNPPPSKRGRGGKGRAKGE